MNKSEMERLKLELVDTMHEFMYANNLNVKGVNIKIYAAHDSFTVVIEGEN